MVWSENGWHGTNWLFASFAEKFCWVAWPLRELSSSTSEVVVLFKFILDPTHINLVKESSQLTYHLLARPPDKSCCKNWKKRLISINFWRLFASCSKTHWVTSIVCTKQLSTQFVIKVRQSVANWTLVVVLSNHNHQQLFLKDFHITL